MNLKISALKWTILPGRARPDSLLEGLSRQADPVFLESAAGDPRWGRYGIASCSPVDLLSLSDGRLTDMSGQTLAADRQAIWRILADNLNGTRLAGSPADMQADYAPGWIGYIGYEFGRQIERLPGRAVRDTALPDLRLAFYDAILVYDNMDGQWRLCELQFDDPPPQAGQAADALREIFRQAAQNDRPSPGPDDQSQQTGAAATYQSNFTPDQYRRAVEKCIGYIAAGDIFQVNLSQRLTVPDCPDGQAIYRRLRTRNPAWYAAYMSFHAGGRKYSILSSSPELFLRLRRGHVVTRPIKGTRRRTGHGDIDAQAAAELLASPKDNAELAMIIDLLRNDLGRVCGYGSVRVTNPRCLESHPTVFHLVGTVEGELLEGAGPVELLRATFPGGSITGAPKIRAMEIIDELEGLARGIYTGCIGIFGVNGSCELNIAIRTVVCDGWQAFAQVGGGIVADSTPQGEYEETLDKAKALLEAIEWARRTA
ncbi:MAG: anthranilate synthase component I family protein [Planctomycetes bacterium]|nr:anthranilate synthase component I family protein [Planctomycetota bacterium]